MNETEKIFLQTTGLKSAKYALLNEEYKQIIGMANLNQIENWEILKTSSNWFDIIFQEQKDNKNTLHPSFSFVSNNKDNVLNFSLKLVDYNIKIVKFTENEFIEFLG